MSDPTPKPRAEVWRPFIAGQARPCAKCDIPIIFGANRVPLDLTTLRLEAVLHARTCTIDAAGAGSSDCRCGAARDPVRWLARSHFETCPAAAAFSGKGRR